LLDAVFTIVMAFLQSAWASVADTLPI